MPTAIETFPEFKQMVRELVEQHRKIKKQRLRLAVYFAPQNRDKQDIFLFEIIDGFGGNAIDPDNKLFEFGYGSTPAFPLEPGTSLRMVLTNPVEFAAAISENWKAVAELRQARLANQATVVYADASGKRLWEKIK